MARLGHGICESLLMASIGHIGGLNKNESQIETTWRLIKIWFENYLTKLTSLKKRLLTLLVLCIWEIYIKIIKLNFYFCNSLWCRKGFYEGLKGLKGLHKTFWGTTKKCENKNLNLFLLFVRDWDRKG